MGENFFRNNPGSASFIPQDMVDTEVAWYGYFFTQPTHDIGDMKWGRLENNRVQQNQSLLVAAQRPQVIAGGSQPPIISPSNLYGGECQ